MRQRGLFRLVLLLLCCSAALHASANISSTLSYRRFTTQDGLPQMQTETVWQDSYGYIYIGTLSGFVRYDGREMTPFLKGSRMNIVHFQEMEGKVMAFSFRRYWTLRSPQTTLSQRNAIDPQGVRLLNNFNAVTLPPGYILTEDADECNRELCHFTANGLQPAREGENPMAARVLDEMTPDRKLFVDSTGLYVPTPNGLYYMDTQSEPRLLSKCPDIYTLCRYNGQLLAFSNDSIYTVFPGASVTNVTAVASAVRGTVHSLSTDYGLIVRTSRTGQLLLADDHSLYRLDGNTLVLLATGFNLIKDLFFDSWDRLWMATYQGAYCFFNRRFTNHCLADANDIVRAVAPLPDGRMVMGTLNGKLLVGDSLVSNLPENFFVPSSAIVNGKVYMACRGDVACVESADSLSASARVGWLHLPYDRYQFVTEAFGRLILGTRRMVVAYNTATATVDTLASDIPHPWCAAADADGRLWVGSTYGLFCVTPGSKGAPSALQKVDYRQQLLIITAMASDPNGTVFFASTDSLFTIRHGQVEAASDSVLRMLSGHEVRSLHVSQQGYLVAAVIDGIFVMRLDADSRLGQVAFFDHRSGFTMIEPQQARMAETHDGTVWVPCLEGMTSFRPGELLVDSLADTYIAPPTPWWKRWWVLAAAIVLLLAAAITLAILFERRHHNRRLQRLQREKKQKELQISAIRLKAIPHFHANVLAGIEYFLMNNATAEATRYLKLYSDFTNYTLSDIDRPSRTVAEEVEYTRLYLQLEQLRYGDRLHYTITVADNVNQQLLLPTMLLHTYCQNALKHGIGNRPEGGHISVSISSDKADVIVSVADDGVGRTAAAALNTNSTRQGLRILMEQIELYNQTNSRPIRQTVTDLTDNQGRPAGTRFQLAVPIDYNFNS